MGCEIPLSILEQTSTMNGKITEISRKELYEQVWTEPMSTLAKRYCISDVGLAKICKRNGIPRPGRGYWARIQARQRVQRTDTHLKYACPANQAHPSTPGCLYRK